MTHTKSSKHNLTEGSVFKTLLLFSLPYLLSCFMQTFYGMADLFFIGRYHEAATISAVSIGSQVMHMLTVILVGLSMGSTVKIGNAVGAKNAGQAAKTIGSTTLLFTALSAVLTVLLLCLVHPIVNVMLTPMEAAPETAAYLIICFAGIPFIVAYNVISSIFRGLGDSKSPMYFVAIACIVNIVLDYIFIGILGFGAAGAAFATIIGQAVSSVAALISIKKRGFEFPLHLSDFKPDYSMIQELLKVGFPISMQDGFIQVSFIIITIIANSRGLISSTSVGIVEKIIGFLFLVPSALLSSISAVTAQNMGAGKKERAQKSLGYGLMISVGFGILACIYCQFLPGSLVALFTHEEAVILAGNQYLQAYSFDCIFAAVHFCLSGYFCGCGKSIISFIHNTISILLLRIPVAYLTSLYFLDTLYPMGLAAPLGSALSALICIGFYYYEKRKTDRGSF